MILLYKWLRLNLKTVYITLTKYHKLSLMAKMSSNVLLRQHAIMNAYKLQISFMCFFPMLFMKTVRINASMFIFRQNSSSASFVTSSCVSWHICALTHEMIVFVLRKKRVCLNRYFCVLEKRLERLQSLHTK